MTDPILAMAALQASPEFKAHGAAMVLTVRRGTHAVDVPLVTAVPYTALEVRVEAELPRRQRHTARFRVLDDRRYLVTLSMPCRIRGKLL